MKVPRGLKPVLLEGTDGRYDNYFEFVRFSLEEMLEFQQAWSILHEFASSNEPKVDIRQGTHHSWVTGEEGGLSENAYVISETNNPDWCFLTHLSGSENHSFNLTDPFDRRIIARMPEVLSVEYNFREEAVQRVSFEHADYRCNGKVRRIWVQRYHGKFDAENVKTVEYNFQANPNFKARGWQKLNHDHIYAMCIEMGVDLQDPDLLSGRYVIVDPGKGEW